MDTETFATWTVTDTIGTGGSVAWDADSQDLIDVIGQWYDCGAEVDDDGHTIGECIDDIDAAVRAGEYAGSLLDLLGITIKIA